MAFQINRISGCALRLNLQENKTMQHHPFIIGLFLLLVLVIPGVIAMRMFSTVFFADTRHPSENTDISPSDAEQTGSGTKPLRSMGAAIPRR
jgi:hypothetical protein